MATGASQVSETTTLLGAEGLRAEGQVIHNGEYGTNPGEGLKQDRDLETSWRIESKLLTRYSTPLFVTYLLQYSFQTTTVIVAGRLGMNELGAISLATMTANVTGLAIYEGLATSLDTLCSQAYGGGRKDLVGLHLQRMVYLLWLVTIPVGIVWICSPWILEAVVPEKELAQLAGLYLRIYLIGMPGFATFEAGKRLVQAQGDFMGSLVVLLICAPLNVFLNWLFVFVGTPLEALTLLEGQSGDVALTVKTLFIRTDADSRTAIPMGLCRCATRRRDIEHSTTIPPDCVCALHRSFQPSVLAWTQQSCFQELGSHGQPRSSRRDDDLLRVACL